MSSTSNPPKGHFKVLYFAGASSFTGRDSETWPAPLPLSKLFAELESKYPDIPAPGDASAPVIQESDEVAIIPPVSSG
ncbi:hypothetical protein VFPPC_09193 [Pochonia chlamydosporia 170]|uniref:Molybdopterin synthase sulfur carrier subunit n=1 Tax=Pochonia chlamydosporia 170 TaxID=1380566 RepID=A0A179FD82_METCM|nr:hypothetical protein VFPPC_09193 [Pochonia chlamydosporia 170]OAQ63337.1 hypothetical protein VFPPC_09193 [Pochonia chlamydosporia 170]